MRPILNPIPLAFCLLLIGCDRNAPVAPATHDAPAATTPSLPRVVSTVPAATYNLLLIGAGDRLVGVSKYDLLYLPEDKRSLPVVGDYENKDYERIVALKPTALVVQMAENRIEPRLREIAEAHHIQLVNLRFDRVNDIWGSVRALGAAAGMKEQAERAITRAQEELREVSSELSKGPRPKVLYLVSPRLRLVAGGKTFIDEMITLAGGDNVGARAGDGFLEMGREAMVNLAPEVLLVGAADEIDLQPDDPRLKPWINLPVPAARHRRVYLVTDGNALMASINIAQNVRMLGEMIHQPPATQPAGEGP